jgi:hypothetical protein
MAATVSSTVLNTGAFSYIANLISDGAGTAGVAFDMANLTDSTRVPSEIQIVPTNAGGVAKFYVSSLPAFVGGKWQIAIGTLAGAGTDACRLVVRYPHSTIQ